ncbi:hypothetical protein [Bifidobacterium subtile]|jgi:hypothetical protein|nr:hypothetical protein [Bifidobacterium subtile]MCI1222836.1 hypothetical protein [Bifidobacterium subtile]MCI1241297.1 hypothetical protein [Bifidobacterium subtile]MCI1257985.1 hypothetical protein [Bifidobacterium subtile]QOL35645.1 hypothetical protein BS3272_06715 [Bifidobacterium subtile]
MMTVLTFDDVKYAKAEAEAHRRGVDLLGDFKRRIDSYAHDADVRENNLMDDNEIVAVFHTHEELRAYCRDIIREAKSQ